MRAITIEGVLNGWVVTVGCTTLVSENKDKMLSEISRYIDDPGTVEKEYQSNAKNQTYAPQPEAPPEVQDCGETRTERASMGPAKREWR